MSEFYIAIHSDASLVAFPDNTAGNFKTILPREINFNDIEYSVAISSITRYYETSMEDLVILRQKRNDVPPPTTPGLTLAATKYPEAPNKEEIANNYLSVMAMTDP